MLTLVWTLVPPTKFHNSSRSWWRLRQSYGSDARDLMGFMEKLPWLSLGSLWPKDGWNALHNAACNFWGKKLVSMRWPGGRVFFKGGSPVNIAMGLTTLWLTDLKPSGTNGKSLTNTYQYSQRSSLLIWKIGHFCTEIENKTLAF